MSGLDDKYLRCRRLRQVETGDGQLDNPRCADSRVGCGRRRDGSRERVEDAADTRIIRLGEIGTGKLAVRLAERARELDALAT